MSKKQKTVSLVLGSGGARGLAHIGVIKWLEEHGYVIRSIAGSSMGALVGGIYATGKLDIYEHWVRALRKRDVMQLLDFAYSRAGLFSGDRIIRKLRDMLGETAIEDLSISFTAVATDLDAHREIWLTRGSLFDAIRASMAIPTVFTPVRYQGHLLVDGGLLNPVPIAPTLKDVTDMTVAVSLSGKEEKFTARRKDENDTKKIGNSYQRAIVEFIEGLQARFTRDEPEAGAEINVFDLMSQSYEAMENLITRFKLAAYNLDCLVEIPANACGIFEFYRAEEMIELGYERAQRSFGQGR
ncbi:MAG: serine protease [Gammaproteobacteria bacterium]|nr:serine protease [Gammaproteobacteria bacterium]